MTVFLGDDWAEAHHDVHLMNEQGEQLDAKRLPEGLKGIAALHAIGGGHADNPSDVIVGIETELATHFEQHPNATTQPSLAETAPARHQSPSHQ